ncbi:hypothetical protein B0H19DRAFT_1079348 [Mycena capillaripes]|nr:hypothetical protein B0H19DRAFT_1079348 [Mycena capillaripes]
MGGVEGKTREVVFGSEGFGDRGYSVYGCSATRSASIGFRRISAWIRKPANRGSGWLDLSRDGRARLQTVSRAVWSHDLGAKKNTPSNKKNTPSYGAAKRGHSIESTAQSASIGINRQNENKKGRTQHLESIGPRAFNVIVEQTDECDIRWSIYGDGRQDEVVP